MRRLFVTALSLGAAAIFAISLASLATAAPGGKEMTVVSIPDKTKLLKATLQGKYIFVHDEERMAKGEPCIYVYDYSEDQAGKPETKAEKLIVSFHCVRVQRAKANHVVLTYGMISPELYELREIQFEGSSDGHQVP